MGGRRCERLARRSAGPRRHGAALHRRRPLWNPRHQLQPRHVPAPAGRCCLAHGQSSQLLHQGYPLGPHAIVVALTKGLGVGLVQGFTGLTVAVAVLASLTALTAFRDQPPLLRIAAALVVGLTYMVASYFAQGSFKETMQALFFLAFVLALREATQNPAWRKLPLRFVPAALLAVGSVYTYSFPGLIWLIGAAVIWALVELARVRFGISAGGAVRGGRERRRTPARGPPRRRDGPRRLAPRPLGVPPLHSPDRPRDRPDDRLPQLRDLRPQRPRPRQPLRPDLALRGVRHLAVGRFPP